MIRQLPDVAAVCVHDVDVVVAIAVAAKRNSGAVGRPGAVQIRPWITSQPPDVVAIRGIARARTCQMDVLG